MRWKALVLGLLFLCQSAAYAADTASDTDKDKDKDKEETPVAKKVIGGVFWQGTSGGFDIVWSVRDLVAMQGKKLVYSARKDISRIKRRTIKGCEVSQNVRLLSVVGPYMSFAYASSSFCPDQEQPGGEARYFTIDLRKPTDSVSHQFLTPAAPLKQPELTDIFPATDIMDALRHNEIIKTSLTEVQLNDIHDFKNTLDDSPKLKSEKIEDICGALDTTFFNAFCFNAIRDNKISIKFGVPGKGRCRYSVTQIGITLPIPPALKSDLNAAVDGKNGCLMGYMNHIYPGWQTEF